MRAQSPGAVVLRAKYADAKGREVFDPAFKKVVSLVFKSRDRRRLPYAEISTFLDAPHRPKAEARRFRWLDVALENPPPSEERVN
jgi:hypothetical protein